MPDSTRQSKRWALTRPALEAILGRLDTDPERAAAQYEALRERLESVLSWWGAHRARELADVTLDRVAVKLLEGAIVPDASLHAYLRGVAHLVYQESLREEQREERIQRDAAGRWDAEGDAEEMHRALDGCLETLAPEERTLVLDYYAAEGSNSTARRGLASRLGISQTALRIRVHRLRGQLEQCVEASTTAGDETF